MTSEQRRPVRPPTHPAIAFVVGAVFVVPGAIMLPLMGLGSGRAVIFPVVLVLIGIAGLVIGFTELPKWLAYRRAMTPEQRAQNRAEYLRLRAQERGGNTGDYGHRVE